jgi:imidazolonepropionase-like amidohydrolase
MSDSVGSIEPGKRADLAISSPIDSIARIPYSFASQLIEQVIAGGQLIDSSKS